MIRTFPKSLCAVVLAAVPAAAQQTPPAPAAVPTPAPVASPTPAPTPAAVAPAPPPPRAGCDPAAGDICLNAEKQEQIDQGHFHAEGFVDLQAGTSRIQADQLDMYKTTGPDGRETRRVVAQGNVVFMHGAERLSGDKLEMDLGTSQGLFENAHGFISSGVLVEAGTIRRIDANTYKVEDAHFTSCTQPNPRWSFSASSATLKIDDHIRAHNVVFRVKDVPAFYVPYLIYPIEDDQRSTGILFPHFGQSDARGFNIGTGFFWAMSRSYDQTFYFDHFSKFGYGLGHELRYMLTSPSRGTFRTYGFRRSDGGGWEHDFNWNAVQTLPWKWRATLSVQESSTLVFQEQFQDTLDLASRRDRRSSASMQRSFGPLNVQVYADSVDTFFGSTETFRRQRHLPALVVNHSARKLGRSGLVFGFESRAERITFGDQDLVNRYSRFDLYPRLSRPMSVSFLQVTPQVQVRATRYGATSTDDGFVDDAIDRRYLETSVEARGPTFSRVFENAGGFYSDRYKHVIGPEVTWTYRSKVDNFDSIPRFDYLDQVLGTNEVNYALVQRLYAKRPGASGKPEAYEFLNWRLAQTYYVDIAEGQNEFDPNYSAVYGADGLPAHYSALQSRLRLRPTPGLTGNFDLEYDVKFRFLRNFSVNTTASYPRGELRLGWNRSTRIAADPEDRVLNRDFMRGSARFQVLPRKVTLEGSLDYDLLTKNLVQATARMRYEVQCCGLVAEMIQSDYNAKQERQFRFAIELANIGSIGNFMGPEAAGGFLGETMSEPAVPPRILITGGAGFIGANFVHHVARAHPDWQIVVLDKLTYAGRRENLAGLEGRPGFVFVQGDIADPEAVGRVMPGCRYVVNLAAETHVDRSLYDAGSFIHTDVYGTFVLLEEARRSQVLRKFVQISTDEVYGSVETGSSRETDALMPRNPYSASKAGADRLAYSYFATYGLPVVVTRASNNYGPYQFPEKVIPLFVTHAIDDLPLPLYGDGMNVRDWLHVDDHCRAVDLLLEAGVPGETYNVGGGNEVPNIELTRRVLKLLGKPESLIRPVADRPGHDRRYSLDCGKLRSLGWAPTVPFDDGLRATVDWYREHESWWRPIKEQSPAFRDHYQRHYKA